MKAQTHTRRFSAPIALLPASPRAYRQLSLKILNGSANDSLRATGTMDFLNHVREILRLALSDVIRSYIPEHLRIPFALGLILIGVRCTLDPRYIFRKRLWAPPVESRARDEDYTFYTRCVGVLLLVAAGVLLEFG